MKNSDLQDRPLDEAPKCFAVFLQSNMAGFAAAIGVDCPISVL